METPPYALECLYGDLQCFFHKFQDLANAPSLAFKKHTVEKNSKEISFNVPLLKKYCSPLHGCTDESCVNVACHLGLTETTASWKLPIQNISVSEPSTISLKLSRQHAFRCVLLEVLESNEFYGDRSAISCAANVTAHLEQPNSLTDLRIQLLSEIAKNLLKTVGYSISEEESTLNLTFGTKKSNCRFVRCGHVLDENGDKVKMTVQQYQKLREKDIRAMSEARENVSEVAVERLTEAAVIVDLVLVKTASNIVLNTSSEIVKHFRENSSKGGTSILYNYARIAAIRRKYDEAVRSGHYPHFPSIHDVDFSVLSHQEEWELLFDFLLEYPVLLKKSTERADKGEIQQHLLLRFIFKLCDHFSVYYSRYRILQDAKPHLLPLMFARLYLTQAVQIVLKHCLNIFGIKPVDAM